MHMNASLRSNASATLLPAENAGCISMRRCICACPCMANLIQLPF